MTGNGLEIRIPCPELEPALAEFFSALQASGDEAHFHPHPLTADEARRRCTYTGSDLYYLLVEGHEVLGYGMLRGWDEGYEVPSLGIALRKSARGCGLAGMFMQFLHAAARRRGAGSVMLKVYRDNLAARHLYEQLGYRFSDSGAAQLHGSIDL